MSKGRKSVLIAASAVILLMAVPMALWCLSLVNQAAVDTEYRNAGIGCVMAVVIYLLSIPLGIAGLIGVKKGNRKAARILALILLAGMPAAFVFLLPYFVMTLLPLFVFTAVIAVAAGASKREEK